MGKKSELRPILFWVGLSVLVMMLAYQLGLRDKTGLESANTPGPGLIPFLSALGLFFVSIYMLVDYAFKNKAENEIPRGDQPKPEFGKIILVLGSLLAYAFLVEPLGYVVTTSLTLFLLFKRMGGRWGFAAIASAVTTVVTYLVFIYLGVLLPEGILPLPGVGR
jgi:putative tricarboxylic transport membrane protein